ncbi:MAG: helix-turn-helix domain-containing protein [Lachnospiraceae bacterium]
MLPKINRKETGINLRKIMDRRGVTVKDVQQYLGLDSVQSIYHWLNGLSMPTLENLYALSALLQVTMDELVCGNKEVVVTPQARRLYAYYRALSGGRAA